MPLVRSNRGDLFHRTRDPYLILFFENFVERLGRKIETVQTRAEPAGQLTCFQRKWHAVATAKPLDLVQHLLIRKPEELLGFETGMDHAEREQLRGRC